ncbi:NitT/TauT family transport system substrate-binding protein [Trichlorobacter thiogenes]|uniref:Thiamine pyrimidine synthase n=1 Tax=Trichlorobacter thiogenes TaxID=115783 RepID=A0A1T4NJZ9_9BACT|nr:ABC transporter substrate-binding protein [Trichlorobacter thiogenes]SJZ79592.1 NitT/TauT family transport system substrate-binding protein [Trichlorobacter thiogenes]
MMRLLWRACCSKELRLLQNTLLLVLLCSSAVAASPLKKATLMPLWSPQAQFAGYYVALEKGIYARHGIDLKILPAGPGYSPEQTLKNGSADFAVLWLTTALRQRADGTQLVNLAQLVQRSSLLLISKKSSGIRSVADLDGRKVGLWAGDLSLPPRIIFARQGIKVREVPQSYTVNLFLRGGIEVTSAMWYNEYHTILSSGVDADELSVIPLHEQGIQFPEDGIYTLERILKKDPALAKAFVAASLEGWRYAFDHPDQALDIVIKQMRAAQLPANRAHQKWMLDRMRDLIMTSTAKGGHGQLNQQEYEAVGQAMRSYGLLKAYPDYSRFTGRSDAGTH